VQNVIHEPVYGGARGDAWTYQSHSTHTENDSDDVRGPSLACADGNDTDNYPLFVDGQNLVNTTVCYTCHSTGGPYDGIDDTVIGAKNNWENAVYTGAGLTAGKEKWCVICHDSGTSVIEGR